MSRAYYETADMMRNRIDMYFDRVESGEVPISDSVTLRRQKPSITGLALFLGFSSVSAFKNYMLTSDEFAEAVAYGYLRVENHYEQLLQTEKMSKAGEVGLRRVGEWRESLDVNVGGDTSHSVYIGEAIKKWRELPLKSVVTIPSEPNVCQSSLLTTSVGT